MYSKAIYSKVSNPLIGSTLGIAGLIIAAFPFLNPSFLLEVGGNDGDQTYSIMMLLPLGVFSIGLALIALSVHMLNKNILLSIVAFALTATALGCFAVGSNFLWAILAFIIVVAIMWEISILETES